MKNIYTLSLFLSTLAASVSWAADPVPDPFLSADSGSAPSLTAPTPPSDNPSPSLGKEAPAPAATAPTPSVSTTPDTPVAPVPPPEPSKPIAPPPLAAEVNPGGDIYDQYDEFLAKERERKELEIDLSQRALFPHENGSWQINAEYIRNAFGDYDFNNKDDIRYPKTFGDTSGPGVSLLFFPIHSLTFGRLGLGVTGAYYWSKFNLNAPNGASIDKPSGGSIYTYGGKVVYELDYWLGQILVPYVYFGYDQVFVRAYSGLVNGVKLTDFPSYRTTSKNYGAGLHFNLNRVEPTVASKALANVGVRKFYLTYRASQRQGEFSGLTHSLGLTFEF